MKNSSGMPTRGVSKFRFSRFFSFRFSISIFLDFFRFSKIFLFRDTSDADMR
uniref:Uncharacterized protein n=1 Tax=Meloidogyne enterolobii TaxID=390850 RepID=A0A6V7UNQ3_MELEN|nr:unnamed protein product [Meloidogyne enterolobii]